MFLDCFFNLHASQVSGQNGSVRCEQHDVGDSRDGVLFQWACTRIKDLRPRVIFLHQGFFRFFQFVSDGYPHDGQSVPVLVFFP